MNTGVRFRRVTLELGIEFGGASLPQSYMDSLAAVDSTLVSFRNADRFSSDALTLQLGYTTVDSYPWRIQTLIGVTTRLRQYIGETQIPNLNTVTISARVERSLGRSVSYYETSQLFGLFKTRSLTRSRWNLFFQMDVGAFSWQEVSSSSGKNVSFAAGILGEIF